MFPGDLVSCRQLIWREDIGSQPPLGSRPAAYILPRNFEKPPSIFVKDASCEQLCDFSGLVVTDLQAEQDFTNGARPADKRLVEPEA
jgi:hypothetical protein